jgi:hypothetical protein
MSYREVIKKKLPIFIVKMLPWVLTGLFLLLSLVGVVADPPNGPPVGH